MKHALALLAALTLFTVTAPPAHANCTTPSGAYDQLSTAALTFFHNYIGQSQIETYQGTFAGPCQNAGGWESNRTYHASGQPDFWQALEGTNCWSQPAGSATRYNFDSQTYWKPTTWQFFGNFTCWCLSQGSQQSNCVWK